MGAKKSPLEEVLEHVEVVSDEEAETCDYYICVRASSPSLFEDDLYDFCCECGEKVRYRPHGPTVPKKICVECLMIKGGSSGGKSAA